MSTSLLSKESSTSPAMSEDEHEDVVPPDPKGKWTSPSRNFFPPELGMSSHGLGNLSLYSMKRLERQCCMHVCVQPDRRTFCKRAVNATSMTMEHREPPEVDPWSEELLSYGGKTYATRLIS